MTPSVLPPTEKSKRRLRGHVDLLGRLLGNVLVAENGQELFDLEESVRRKTRTLQWYSQPCGSAVSPAW